CKCSLVSVLLYLFFTIFMVKKADSQQYVEVCTLLLCGWAHYYTACCLVCLQMIYFSAPYLRVLGVILFEVCMLCFIVTFHVTTFDKGNRLVADKTHRFCAPHRQHKCIGYLSVHSVLNSRFLESTFCFFVGFKARHDFRLLRKRYRSQIYLPALLPLTHTTCVTDRARGQH